jgi:hypothetical protein
LFFFVDIVIIIVITVLLRIPAWGARQIARLIGIKYELRGKENIVKGTGAIVLINHQSNLDLCGKNIKVFIIRILRIFTYLFMQFCKYY